MIPSSFRHKDLGFFLTEYFNNSCAENFLEAPQYERCIIPVIREMIGGCQASVDDLRFRNNLAERQPEGGDDNIEITPESEKFTINESTVGVSDFAPEKQPVEPDERQLFMLELYRVLFVKCRASNLVAFQQLAYVEIQHTILSHALGVPVGVVRTIQGSKLKSQTGIVECGPPIRSLLGSEKLFSSRPSEAKFARNNGKIMFLQLLSAQSELNLGV